MKLIIEKNQRYYASSDCGAWFVYRAGQKDGKRIYTCIRWKNTDARARFFITTRDFTDFLNQFKTIAGVLFIGLYTRVGDKLVSLDSESRDPEDTSRIDERQAA